MLSYKLKHLCSRIITSLSAIGIFSITDAQASNIYGSGDTVTNNYLSKTTFYATYESDTVCAQPGAINGIIASFRVSISGERKCAYILDKGWGLPETTGNCMSGLSTGAVYYASGASCAETVYSGTKLSGIIYSTNDEINTTYAAVKDYYAAHSGTISPEQWFITIQDSDGTGILDKLERIETQIVFDCGTGTVNPSGTGFAYVRYGSKFNLPTSGNCIAPSGYFLAGWEEK